MTNVNVVNKEEVTVGAGKGVFGYSYTLAIFLFGQFSSYVLSSAVERGMEEVMEEELKI